MDPLRAASVCDAATVTLVYEAPLDVDTVLLYDAGCDPLRVAAAVRALRAEGCSVAAQKALPDKLRYRRALKLTESGVSELA